MPLTQIKADGIADDAVTLAKQAAGTDGQIITYDASGNPTAVGPGSDGQVLTSTGAGSPPAFEAIPATDTAAHVTVTDNEATDENNLIAFVENAQDSTGSHGLEMDGNFHYNPSTGTCSATAFSATNVTATGTVVANDDVNITAASSNLLFGSTNKVIWDSDDSDTNKITLKATTTLTKDSDYVLPEDGAASTYLKTNGSGALSWAVPASGAASNVVINGEMRIAQRGTSFASVTATGKYPVDRFAFHLGTCGTWTVSQDTDVPTAQGFVKSIKCDVTTADASLGSGDYCRIDYRMEGQDLQRFRKGTANAKDFALSFWVKSPKTGTHIVELQDSDNTRTISQAYTVSSANTWEKKELVISKDTTGALDNDNAKSLQINWWMAAGSGYTSGSLATSWQATDNTDRAVGQVNCADNTSNNFYLTGVQLEVGTVTSDYAFKSTTEELLGCWLSLIHISEPTRPY